MNLRTILTLALALAAAVAGSAQTKNYKLNIGEFIELTVANNVNVVYKSMPDSAGYATYTCAPDAASAIVFNNDKNKLKIQVIADNPIDHLPTVTIYSSALTKVSNWGDSTITVARVAPGAEFKAKVIGNGNIVARDVRVTKVDAAVEAGHGHIYLTGKANAGSYTILSAGAIEAGALEAATVKCMMFGTGNIDCFASEQLSIKGAGSGTVYYLGNPAKVKKRGIGVKAVAM